MSLKIDLETNFAEFVIDAGEVILGTQQRTDMNPPLLRVKPNENILQAVCALLNSGGGVIKAKIKDEDYNHEIHEVGLDLPPVFEGYLDEMQQGKLFLIFVTSWNTDVSGVPLATLCSNLYHRYRSSNNVMDSHKALIFLKEKTDSSLLSPQEAQAGAHREDDTEDSAAALFDREQLQYLEKLNLTESMHVEFQMFPTALSQCVKERLARCVSALANAEGGYVFLGVHDETHQVIGCEKEKINLSKFKNSVECCIRKLPVYHFCTQRHTTQCSIRFLQVHDKGDLRGYVCAVKVERFCCVVFAKVPNSWQLKANKVKPLTTKQWVDWMMQAKPVRRRLSEMFLEPSLSPSMPPSRTVCTQNLERLKVLQKHYFPVSSHRVAYAPESLYQELCSEHKGLRDLIDREMRPVSRGILIFSRSWAVDLGLKENQGVICEALLISQNNTPILYTVFRKWDERFKDDSMKVASSLKQRLVDTGGYTGRVCIVPLFFQLNPVGTPVTPHSSVAQIYPESYNLTTIQHMETLLRSLVRVLFGFRSFVSEKLGSETWNLLTDQQYELLSKNLHETRQLFVHGLPGSGKTTMALKVMQKIRNVFHCEPHEILYICEKQPLKKFVSNKKICKAVTRKYFMKHDFAEIQHIIVDEAQNFCTKDGDWYKKAKTITQRRKDCPGVLWIFLDHSQTNQLSCSGLPVLSDQLPREELTGTVLHEEEIAP
ncbi:schlafen family member 5-like [Ictidomys tridecemlineatus]